MKNIIIFFYLILLCLPGKSEDIKPSVIGKNILKIEIVQINMKLPKSIQNNNELREKIKENFTQAEIDFFNQYYYMEKGYYVKDKNKIPGKQEEVLLKELIIKIDKNIKQKHLNNGTGLLFKNGNVDREEYYIKTIPAESPHVLTVYHLIWPFYYTSSQLDTIYVNYYTITKKKSDKNSNIEIIKEVKLNSYPVPLYGKNISGIAPEKDFCLLFFHEKWLIKMDNLWENETSFSSPLSYL